MTTSSTLTAGGLPAALNDGRGPIIVLDPCGVQWRQFRDTSRGSPLWAAWHLAPGQAPAADTWDVLGALKSVNAVAGTTALAAALFPVHENSDLTRRLMAGVLAFADDTGHFSDLPALAAQLWADDLWTAMARWSRQYPHQPSLQSVRALLTQEGAGEAMRAIRIRMETWHHPHVAEAFAGGAGFSLSTLRQRPGQIIFLTPDIRCLESPALMGVYAFIITALREFGSLHNVAFTFVESTPTLTGDMT